MTINEISFNSILSITQLKKKLKKLTLSSKNADLATTYLTIINKDLKEAIEGHKKLKGSAFSCLAEATYLIINYITNSSFKNLQIEKTASNIITRLIDINEMEWASKILKLLHFRLTSQEKGKCNDDADIDTLINTETFTVKKKTSTKLLKNNPTAPEKFYYLLPYFKINVEPSSDQLLYSMINFAMLYNMIRCCTSRELKLINSDSELEKILKMEYGILFWGNFIYKIDQSIGQRQFDMMFKLICKLTAVPEFKTLEMRKMALIFCVKQDLETFCDIAMRMILEQKLNATDDKNLFHQILLFIIRTFELILENFENISMGVKFNKLFDFSLSISQKVANREIVKSYFGIMFKINTKLIKSEVQIYYFTIELCIEISYFNTSVEKGEEIEEVSKKLENYNNTIDKVTSNQQLEKTLGILMKSFENLRKRLSEYIEKFSSDGGKNFVNLIYIENLLNMCIKIFNTFKVKLKLYYKEYYADNLKIFYKTSDKEISVKYQRDIFLNVINMLNEDFESNLEIVIEEINFLSGLIYNFGGYYLKVQKIEVAVEFFLVSLDILERNFKAEKLPSVKVHLIKRFEVLCNCFLSLKKYLEAKEILIKLLNNFERSDLDNFKACFNKKTKLADLKTLKFNDFKKEHNKEILKDNKLAQFKSELVGKVIDRYIQCEVHLVKDNMEEGNINYYISISEKFASCKDDLELMSFVLKLELIFLQTFYCFHYNVHNFQIVVIDQLLNCFKDNGDIFSTSRMLLEKAKLFRSSESNIMEKRKEALLLLDEAIQLIYNSEESEQKNLNLQTQFPIIHIFKGIILNEIGEYNMNPFKFAITTWKAFFLSIPCFTSTNEQATTFESFALMDYNYDEIYYHLDILSHYFGVLCQPRNRMLVIFLQLKILYLMRHVPLSCSAAASLYIKISQLYMEMGYSGKAGLSLSKSSDIIKSGKCLTEVSVQWKLCYSQYHCYTGNLEKSKNLFNNSMQFVKAPNILENRGKFSSVFSLLQISFSYFVKSNLLFNRGQLSNSRIEALECFRILSKASKFLEKKCLEREKAESGDIDFVQYLDASSFLLNFQLTENMLNMFELLAKIYCSQGCVMEAEHYFNVALELANSNNLAIYKSKILLYLADLECRKAVNKCQLGKSKELIDGAMLNLTQIYEDMAVKETIFLDTCKGYLFTCEESYSSALEKYYVALNILNCAMDQSTIDKLENIIEQEPQGKNLQKAVKTIKTLKNKTSRVFDTSMLDSFQYQCSTLNSLHLKLTSMIGFVAIKQGNFDEAEKIMNLPAFKGCQNGEYGLVVGAIKLKQILKTFQKSPTLGIFCETALSFPPIGFSAEVSVEVPIECQKTTLIQRSQKLLAESFKYYFKYGPSKDLQSVCYNIALLNFINGFVVDKGNFYSRQLLYENLYYLEMSKGFTFRQHMTFNLLNKVKNNTEKMSRSIEWPESMNEQKDEVCSLNAKLLKLYESEELITPKSFAESLNKIPRTWTVCSISIDKEMDLLYVTKYKSNAEPVTLRIGLHRNENSIGYAEVFEIFDYIIVNSNETLKSSLECTTTEKKKEWWKKRKTLDEKLKNLLENVENKWFGGLKGIFNVNIEEPEKIKTFKKNLEIIFKAALPSKKMKTSIIIDTSICHLLYNIDHNVNSENIEDFVDFVLDSLKFSDNSGIEFDALDLDQIVNKIILLLKKRAKDEKEVEGNDLILILDKSLQRFPWESLPILRKKSVSRMPSITALKDRILRSESENEKFLVNINKVSYVLNPEGDLSNTQLVFEKLLKSRKNWNGVISQAPSKVEFLNYLQTSDLFMYFGHGGGDQYLNGNYIRNLDNCSISLLMGCSSGKLTEFGEYEPSGTPLNYLLAGCPAVVANLWDVTDKDIDKYSVNLIEKVGILKEDSKEFFKLNDAVSTSRNVCKLKYLNGAAPVVYGIPVWLKM
ncbi:hypothetical protein HDU92_001934, partial [Lobulomyces angularis]